MAEEVKLFGFWASPFSCRVEVALKLKGVQYEYIEEDLSNKSPMLLQHNPVHQKVPVLVHNGKSIAESLIILEYIEETWKSNPMLPPHPHDRAKARFWAKFIDEELFIALAKAVMMTGKAQEVAMEDFCEKLRMVESELKEKSFFGGDGIGYLDIVGFMIAVWYTRTQDAAGIDVITEDKFPILSKWIEKLLDHDVVRKCHPPKQKHLAYCRARFEAFKAASSS